jgi:hypothetical protein
MKGHYSANEILPLASANKVKGCEKKIKEDKVRKRDRRP